MSIDLNKIFYKSETYDPSTKLPIYVLDSTLLPNPSLCNFLGLIKLLIKKIPNHNYSLIFFTAGLSNHSNGQNSGEDSFKFSWVWGVKTFSLIPDYQKKFLRKLFVVHESWWIRVLTEVLKNLVSSKFLNQGKVIHVSSISELSRHLDITKINISLANYSCEALPESYKFLKIVIPIHLPDVYGIPIVRANQTAWYYYHLVFIKLLQIYHTSPEKYSLVLFHNNSPSLLQKSTVLQDCIARNQLVTLDQFDTFTLVNIWKYFLKKLSPSNALLDLHKIQVSDDLDIDTINEILSQATGYKSLLNDIMNFFICPVVTNDTSHLSGTSQKSQQPYLNKLCQFLVKFFCGYIVQATEDQHKKGADFIKNLIRLWPYVDINELRIKRNTPQRPPPRKSSAVQTSPSANTSQVLANYMQNTSLKESTNKFIFDGESILEKLGISNLNNFNVVSNISICDPVTSEDLEAASPEKENSGTQKISQLKSSIKTYFKPLSDNNSSDLINKMNNLSFKPKAKPPLPEKASRKRQIKPTLENPQFKIPPPAPLSRPVNSSQESLSSASLVSKKLSNSSINEQTSSADTSASSQNIHPIEIVKTKQSTTSISSASSSTSAPKKPVPPPRKPKKVVEAGFIHADKKKYAGIQNGKVEQLALLFEERLESIHILATL